MTRNSKVVQESDMKEILFVNILLFSSFTFSTGEEWLYFKSYPWTWDNKKGGWFYLKGGNTGRIIAWNNKNKSWGEFEANEWVYYNNFPWVWDNEIEVWYYLMSADGGDIIAFSNKEKEWEGFEESLVLEIISAKENRPVVYKKDDIFMWAEDLDGLLGWVVQFENNSWRTFTVLFENGYEKLKEGLHESFNSLAPVIVYEKYEIDKNGVFKLNNSQNTLTSRFYRIVEALEDGFTIARFGVGADLFSTNLDNFSFHFTDFEMAEEFNFLIGETTFEGSVNSNLELDDFLNGLTPLTSPLFVGAYAPTIIDRYPHALIELTYNLKEQTWTQNPDPIDWSDLPDVYSFDDPGIKTVNAFGETIVKYYYVEDSFSSNERAIELKKNSSEYLANLLSLLSDQKPLFNELVHRVIQADSKNTRIYSKKNLTTIEIPESELVYSDKIKNHLIHAVNDIVIEADLSFANSNQSSEENIVIFAGDDLLLDNSHLVCNGVNLFMSGFDDCSAFNSDINLGGSLAITSNNILSIKNINVFFDESNSLDQSNIVILSAKELVGARNLTFNGQKIETIIVDADTVNFSNIFFPKNTEIVFKTRYPYVHFENYSSPHFGEVNLSNVYYDDKLLNSTHFYIKDSEMLSIFKLPDGRPAIKVRFNW